MSDEKNKKLTIEVVKEKDNWLDLLPKLSIIEEGEKEPTIYGKSSLGGINIGVQKLGVVEGIEKSPPSEDSWGILTRIYGEGCMSSTTLGRRMGDTIGFFGKERTDRIDVEISCESYELTEEERKKEIEKKGIDESEHDYIQIYGDGTDIGIKIALRDKTKFDALLRRVGVGEITTLGINISEIGKVAGLYRPEYDYYPEVDYDLGNSFYLLDNSKKISNLSDEELDSIPNKLHFDSYYWQLTDKYSIVDFSIMFNPSWVTHELFGEEDEEEFDDIDEDIEDEEIENSFVPKIPSSDEHIAQQTSVLINIFRLLGVITIIMVLLVITR